MIMNAPRITSRDLKSLAIDYASAIGVGSFAQREWDALCVAIDSVVQERDISRHSVDLLARRVATMAIGDEMP